LPKPLAPVAGKPFLFHLLDLLAGTGIQRAVLSLGYEARQIEDAIKTYHRLQLSCVTERAALGTGGGLRQALGTTQGETLLALNGDSMTPFDLTGFLDFHQKGGWTVSLAAVTMEDCARFGRLDLASGGGVLSFLEKQDSGAGIINAGIYLVKRSLLGSLPLGQPLSFEQDVLEPLTRQGKLGAFPCPGPFIDIGTPESLASAEKLVPEIMARIGS
jgi:NDP-sugar pyrophosphorylase family protein